MRGWKAAVQDVLEDGVLTRDEENALARYADHLRMTPQQLNRNEVQTPLVHPTAIRDIAEGIVPQRTSRQTLFSMPPESP